MLKPSETILQMKRRILKTLKLVLIIIVVIFITLISNYLLIINSKRVPYKNITDRLGFIYVDVMHDHERYTIVTSGSSFYGTQRFYGENKENSSFVSHFMYVIKTYYAIKFNLPIKVNDAVHEILHFDKINSEKVKYYENIDLLNSGNFKKWSYDSHTLIFEDDIKDTGTIMYVLLKKGLMDCRIECESGMIFFVPCKK
jgi:hypothetical protein